MSRILPILALTGMLLLPALGIAEVLTYRGSNRWVAQEDAAPLRKLTAAAGKGHTHFSVRLPAGQRELAVERLEVLQGILEKSAKSGVVLEETSGPAAAAGTLWVAPSAK